MVTLWKNNKDKQSKYIHDFLKKHRKKLDAITEILLKTETMSVEEFVEIFEKK